MSSIAYVSDEKMLEFHRLNRNQEINFWRTASKRRIADLEKGDLVFFLAKGTERSSTKEKGIIGYGVLDKEYNLSLNQMWNQFQERNGYLSKEEFKEAVLKNSKNKVIPKKINSLYLNDIVFFQHPLYLSEFGIKISKNIESYTYIDKDDPLVTSKILTEAQRIGVDFWQLMKEEQSLTNIEETRIIHLVSEAYKEVETEEYYQSENLYQDAKKIIAQVVQSQENNYTNIEYLINSECACVKITSKETTIFLPFVYKLKNIKEDFQIVIGKIQLMRLLLKNQLTRKFNFNIVSNKDIPINLLPFINSLDIDVTILD